MVPGTHWECSEIHSVVSRRCVSRMGQPPRQDAPEHVFGQDMEGLLETQRVDD